MSVKINFFVICDMSKFIVFLALAFIFFKKNYKKKYFLLVNILNLINRSFFKKIWDLGAWTLGDCLKLG